MSISIPESKPAMPPVGRLERARTAIDEQLYSGRERLGAARRARVQSLRIEGRERHGGDPLRVRYVGSGQSLDYLLDKLYREHAVVEREPKSWAVLSGSRLARDEADVDLVIADLPWPYYRLVSSAGFMRIPGWITQRLPLSERWADVLQSFRRNTRTTDLRKVRKFGLEYRLTSERAEIEAFYHQMYCPYAEQRFGSLALIESEEEVLYFGTRGWLLQILHQGRMVGGVVLSEFRGTMHFLWIGLPPELDRALFDAAFSGVYYFSILHAYTRGCREIDLSYTRPLLTNGIYRYKRKWGAHVHDGWRLGELRLRPTRLAPAVVSALAQLPCVTRQRDTLVGKLLLDDETARSAEAIRSLVEQYASPGLAALDVSSLVPVDPELVASLPGVRFRRLDGPERGAAQLCAE